MKLQDPLPLHHQNFVNKVLLPQEKIWYTVASDLTQGRIFGVDHIVVTNQRIVVVSDKGINNTFLLTSITEVKVDELFSGARLLAVIDSAFVELVCYTKNRVPEFGVLCRVINQILRKQDPNLPEDENYVFCPRCKSPLPERGANCIKCVHRLKVFKRLLTYIIPHRKKALLLVGMTTITVGSQLVAPYVTKRIVDDVIKGGHYDQLEAWIFAMAGAATLYFCARLATTMLSTWLSARLVADLRMQLHGAVQRLQLGYFAKRGNGEIVSRIMHDTNELQRFLVDGLPFFLINCTMFILIAIILIRLDLKLALLVFLPVPFLIFGARFFWQKLEPLFHKEGTRIGSIHSILGESIGGIKTVKSFAQENRRSKQFDSQSEQLFRIRFKLEGTWISFQEAMFFIMQIGVTAIWYFAVSRIIKNDPTISFGDLLAFVGYVWLMYGPLQWFTAVLNWMTHAFAGAERIFGLLDTPSEVYVKDEGKNTPRIKGAIEFRNVHFSYERGKEVIKDISLSIAQGEMVGLVGKSGAGKSTIINLICRFFDPDSGEVLIDGADIRSYDLSRMRKQIGMVLQETFLFNSSIIENIRYGDATASFEEVVRAARAANAHEFILDKEDGYDTIIGENGIQLSGGEKQRIAIARAILHDPPILILDEATSSVDSETEKHIQDAIATLIRGRTTIAIAHRLATLRNAKRLFVLDDGKVSETGTHDELIAAAGTYAKLVQMQTELSQIRGEVWKG